MSHRKRLNFFSGSLPGSKTACSKGVLFSVGGRFGGLSLFVKDGHLVYEYNTMGDAFIRVIT
ncbi:MAG: hypothetical protein PHW87_00265 [Methanothrix sp.]|nr:hypothetical protein [Methanothrix sp.]